MQFKKIICASLLLLSFNVISQTNKFDSLNVVKIDNKPLFNTLKNYFLLNSENYHTRDGNLYQGLSTSSDFLVIDGMKIRGADNFPVVALKNLKNYQTYQPLKYGNSLTGIYEIETKGNTREPMFITDVTLPTIGLNTPLLGEGFFKSELKDFDVEIFATTPIANKENAPTITFAGKYFTTNNFYPSSQKYQYLDESAYNELIETPYQLGRYFSANHAGNQGFVKSNAPMNGGGQLYDSYFKFNLPLSEDINITLGNYTSYFANTLLLYSNMMFNYNSNPEHIRSNINSYLRFSHEIYNNENGRLQYQAQVNLHKDDYTIQHAEHKDNLFNYGYVGKFNANVQDNWIHENNPGGAYYYTSYVDSYGHYIPTDSMYIQNPYIYTGKYRNGVSFTPSNINPLLSNYMEYFYSTFYENNNPYDYVDIVRGGGIINGDMLYNSYGLWNAPGMNHNLYSKSNTDRLQVLLNGEYAFGEHTLRAGFEYDKKTYRNYQINPVGLWSLMDQLTNKHNHSLNFYNPIIDFQDFDNDGTVDTLISYPFVYDGSSQSHFDINLRNELGMAVDGLEYIDVNSYSPDTYSMEMFSADELLNDGNSYVSYMGYNPYGEKTDADDPYKFFSDEERLIDAFRPKTTSVYGEYEFKNDIFKLSGGLRVQKYDANQPVLEDPYLLYEAYTVEDAPNSVSFPDFAEDGYVVYVNNYENPTQIVAYRDEDTWFDVHGREIENEEDLQRLNPKPWLKKPMDVLSPPNEDVFVDFTPVVYLLPKLHAEITTNSFRAYAGHQQLAQNPETFLQGASPNNAALVNVFSPSDYYFISRRTIGGKVISNPALEPFKKKNTYIGADFLISDPGFNQDLLVGIKGSQHYLYNMLAIKYLAEAFPSPYYTYGNVEDRIDYRNINSYVKYIYHAEPSIAASFNFTKNLYEYNDDDAISNDIYLWDMCRNIANVDLSVDFSKDNIMPVMQNISFKMFLHHRDGLEYPKVEKYSLNGYSTSLLTGDVGKVKSFSSVSLRLDKGVYVMNNKLFVNAYMLVSNLFNRINYEAVYPSTGEPDDDGFLKDAMNQGIISGQLDEVAFSNQYRAALENPYNFGLARQIKFGIQFVFR